METINHRNIHRFIVAAILIASPFFSGSAATAQNQKTGLQNGTTQRTVRDTDDGDVNTTDALKLTGRFHMMAGSRKGYLILKAEIPEGNHIYSTTQKGDIPPTTIVAKNSAQYKISGKFAEDRTAEITPNDPVFHMRVEKHKHVVQFFAPIELAAGVDPQKLKPEMTFNGQICSEAGFCMPIRDQKVSAKFGGYFHQKAKKQANSSKIR